MIKAYWNVIAGVALTLLSFVNSFFDYPEYLGNAPKFSHFANWIVVIVVGLMLIPMARWKNLTGWIILALLFLIIAASGFFWRQQLEYENTYKCKAKDTQVLIGSPESVREDYFENGKLYLERENPKATDERIRQLLKEYLSDLEGRLEPECKPHEIWKSNSITRTKIFLERVYIFFLPFFILTMMAMIQASKPYIDSFFPDQPDETDVDREL